MKNNLFENLAPHIRRRLKPEHLKHVLNTIIEYDYDFTPCSYDDVGEFVSEICDTLKDVFLDNISMEFPVELTPKDKDDVYYYFVDLFGDYLVKEHKKLCSGSLQSNESLMENVSPEVRRRIDSENLKDLIDYIVEYEFNAPCEYPVGEFVAEVCDLAVNNIVDYVVNNEGLQKVTFKDRDNLYYFFVDTFGDYLSNYYRKKCGKLKESKKKIIITESQYHRLFEDVKPKKTKQESFQKLIDENLKYIKNYCNSNQAIYKSDVGIATCDVVDMINSIKITDLQMMSSAGTDMHGNLQNVTPSIHIKLLVNFTSLSFIVDFDEVIYDLKHMLRKATGMLIIFDYDQENTVKDRQW
jgi:hypothetical protein